MFIAMNRFQVREGSEAAFERVWAERESELDAVPGFREFHLLRGPSDAGVTLFVSHSRWESRDAFEAWTKSEAFRKAHAHAGETGKTLVGHPQFEGFEIVL